MTLTLELPSDVEGALAQEAQRKGTTPERLALDGLRQLYVLSPSANPLTAEKSANAMQALFAQWDAEDETDDAKEIVRRNRDWEQTKANLAANRFTLEGRTDFRALLGEDDPQEKAA